MPIIIRMKDQSEYAVNGEYTLKDFRQEFIDTHDDYVEFDAKIGSDSIPTIVVKENIISVQDRDLRVKALKFTR